MVTENFLPKKPGINGYGSGQAGWSGVDLKILPREGSRRRLSRMQYEGTETDVSVY